jgi:hypothetical protein
MWQHKATRNYFFSLRREFCGSVQRQIDVFLHFPIILKILYSAFGRCEFDYQIAPF